MSNVSDPIFSAGQPVLYGWGSPVYRIIGASFCRKRFCWMYECMKQDGHISIFPECGLDNFRAREIKNWIKGVA